MWLSRAHVHLHVLDAETETKRQLANVLRGLANAFGGYAVLSGRTDEVMLTRRVVFWFSSPKRASEFVNAARELLREEYGGPKVVKRVRSRPRP